ncbi:Gfo/Idh/MocA family oxidoreductase [Desulfovibrio sp.]|uniref:Gfo/Idh/MocA family protein n=1 Tax=Desulfovibrio sp. TaxID=885 RepID=UPI0025B7E9CF|nr:Gfo/Idh/MocA family oxidoreductase [Desulfovibrio sp.]
MIRVALVGCGRISVRHCELLGGGKIQHASLACVCDINPERAQARGEQWSVPWFTDMHEMMQTMGEQINLVAVLTESGNHANHTVELAQYQKHILVEKPMALTLDDADKMIKVCDQAGIKLFVVKQNRFNVPVQHARKALLAGRFGKLVMGSVRVRWCRPQRYYDQDAWRGTWALDGGVLTNQASHHVDLLEWMLGDVESVFAKSRTALVNIEAEDTAIALLKFRNGALGIIEATTATRPKDLEGSLSVLGEKGSVVIGGFAVNKMETWQFDPSLPEDEDVMEKYSVNPPDVYGFGHKAYYDHVVSCLEDNKSLLVDGLEGRKSLELIMAIYESIETNKEVFLHFSPQKCRLGHKE